MSPDMVPSQRGTTDFNKYVIMGAARESADAMWQSGVEAGLEPSNNLAHIVMILAETLVSEYVIGYVAKYLIGKYGLTRV